MGSNQLILYEAVPFRQASRQSYYDERFLNQMRDNCILSSRWQLSIVDHAQIFEMPQLTQLFIPARLTQ